MKGSPAVTVDQIWSAVGPLVGDYPFDHYRLYPAAERDGWTQLLHRRLLAAEADPERRLFFVGDQHGQALICLRASSWDEEHFGFGVGTIELLFASGLGAAFREGLSQVLACCEEQQLRFVSARINGDQLGSIHALETEGFRYVENIIWPVADCRKENASLQELGVRLLVDEDLEQVAAIARSNQYQRGHYHCDPGFSRGQVDLLYERWLRSAYAQGKPILVVEEDGLAVGYFVLDLPADLSACLGSPYGGMRSLGLGAASRGKGLGRRLFRGAVAWLRDQGCDYVDSGYASKNHLSARLHQGAQFNSVYEEVTMHRWLR